MGKNLRKTSWQALLKKNPKFRHNCSCEKQTKQQQQQTEESETTSDHAESLGMEVLHAFNAGSKIF